MLDLEIVPERSLGCDAWEFVLGMHFSQSVAIIQSQVGTIRGVQVLYSDQNPLSVDLVINMPQDGIRLIFDPVAQRLKVIEIYNMKLVKLRYSGMCFNSPEISPSIEQVEHCFGATHPGLYDSQRHLFALNFRGLSFYFPVDSKFEPGYAHGLGSLQFPNGGSPVVSRTTIYYGSQHQASSTSSGSVCGAPLPELPLSCYRHQLHLRRCDVLRTATATQGLRLHMFTEGESLCTRHACSTHRLQCKQRQRLRGASPGAAAVLLPPPAAPAALRRTPALHTGCSTSSGSVCGAPLPELPLSCYRHQLHLRRCDVLRTATATQGLRLHMFTEGPNRSLTEGSGSRSVCRVVRFGSSAQRVCAALGAPARTYYKADDKMRIHRPTARRRPPPASDYFFNYFTLGLDVLFDARTHQVKKFVLHTNYPGHYNFNMYHRCEFELTVQPDKCEANSLVESRGAVCITAYSKWEVVSRALRVAERPVVLNRASSTNTTNPFGSTFCYGYQDIIFEVSTQHQAYSKWEEVSRVAERPVVLNRASSTNTTNPFGSTFCYGYQDIIFEVSTQHQAYSKWEEVSRVAERPVVLNRASSTNTTNPFGSTFCYGYQDIIFEVSTQHQAYSKWEEVSRVAERPVVLNRASSTNTTNPFGSTFCYGYQDIIFEVSTQHQAYSKWEEVSRVAERPVVLNRASSTNTTNPFGSTFCYGYQDIIFEVSTQHQAYSKWEEVSRVAERPVVLNRASSTNTTNPFGSTFCYGYQDIIFEVSTQHQAYSKWEEVSRVAERPVVLNRASSTNTTNPFGSTFCYGYQDIIFEVSTQHQAYSKWEEVSRVAERPVVLNRASSTNTTNPFGSTFCYGYQDIIFEVSTQHQAYSKWEEVSRVAERPVVLNRASSTNTTNPFGSTFCYGYQDIIFEVSTQHQAYSKWEEVSRVAERPVVLNRASSTNTTNPFGSTFCYGYQDIIFEVMSNNYIASITLYQPEGTRPRYAVNSIA
ncbi:hypothetical protein PYW07_009581 [Mythimna separata]|uniref:Uncharacterized protein n=1 Tax=Mythimna separata TaxID=271217 RepID=A0AAD7YCK3_MYTSE|nr:hypothetical protein PYW07_009581 [Mythimna separata]